MKKILIGIGIVMLGASGVFAAIDDPTTAVNDLKPAHTQTNAFTVRGKLVGITVNAATPYATSSNQVALTYNGETLFSMQFTNSISKYPLVQAHSTAGAALYVVSLTNADATSSSNAVYVSMPVAGVVTQKCTGTGPYTNDWTVKLLIEK